MNIQSKKTKRGLKYRARFTINYTAFASPWYFERGQAVEWEANKRVEIINGQVNTGSAMSFRDFISVWLDGHSYARKTLGAAKRDEQFLRRYLEPKLGHKKLRSITTAEINFVFSTLLREQVLAPKTINNGLGIVKLLFKHAQIWGYISANPAALVQRVPAIQREVTTYFDEEVDLLLCFTKEHYPEEHWLITFAINSGCRLGECLGLRWGKIDLENGFAHIGSIYDETSKSVVERTKGRRFRKVPLNSPALEVLREMILKGRKAESDFVFSRIDYGHFTRKGFKRIILAAGLQEAEARGANFHSFRHTFASAFMRRGGNIYELQKILGHCSVIQTERYSHFAADYLKGATARVSFTASPKGSVSFIQSRN